MNFKKIIALILAVFMVFSPINSFTGISFGDVQNYITIEISGQVNPDESISFLAEKDQKRYYIDSIKVEDDGTYVNSFKIPKGIEALINIFANKKTLSFEILNDNTIDIKSEGHDSSQVKFQYSADKFSIEIGKNAFYSGSSQPLENEFKDVLNGLIQYQKDNNPSPGVGSVGGDWTILGIARSENQVPGNYYSNYYREVLEYVVREAAKESRRFGDKVTDVERLVLALTAIGQDPRDINGVNLLDFIWDKENSFPGMKPNGVLGGRQGSNELIFGLLALDSKKYEEAGNNKITRSEIISTLINDYQMADGSVSLSKGGSFGGIDISAMALQALAPYYDSNLEAKGAIDKIISYLSSKQGDDGSFIDTGFGTSSSSESCAQVITGLVAVGINPNKDERFIKNGNSAIDGLLLFRNIETGGFAHNMGGDPNQMSCDQALHALVAYDRFVKEKTSLYDMTDVKFNGDNNEIVTKKFKLGTEVTLEENTIYSFEDVVIDTTSIGINGDSSLKVYNNTSAQLPADYKVEKAGPIVEFEFKNALISAPVEVVLPITESSLADKSSIYHYDDEKGKWEYVESKLKDGKLFAKVDHFSTYGVLADLSAPKNVKGILAYANKNGVKIGFAGEDISKIKRYDLYKDDFSTVYASVTDDFYIDSAAKLGQSYKYKVKAVDLFDNISEFSSEISASPVDDSASGGTGTPEGIPVYIRVVGYNGDLIPKKLIYVKNFGLDEYLSPPTGSSASDSDGWGKNKFPNGPTHAHALVKALESGNFSYDFQDYGWSLYVAEINGEREFDLRSSSGWMYDVNGSLPGIGSQGRYLSDYDNVTWYFSVFGYENLFPEMKINDKTITTDDVVTLTLTDKRKKKPIENAIIMINGEESQYVTNSQGQVNLYFDKDGSYYITARHLREGLYDMIFPEEQMIQVGSSQTGGGSGSGGGGGGGKPSISTQYTEEYSVIRKTKSSEKEVIDALNNVRDKIYGKMLKVETVEDASKLSSDILDAANLINWSSDKIETREAAEKTFEMTKDLMNSVVKSVKVLSRDETKNRKAINDSLMATKTNTDNALKTLNVLLKENEGDLDLDEIIGTFSLSINDLKRTISQSRKAELDNLLNKSTMEFLSSSNEIVSKVKEGENVVVFDKNSMAELKESNEITEMIAKKLLLATDTNIIKEMRPKLILKIESDKESELHAYIDKDNLRSSGISEESSVLVKTTLGSIEIPDDMINGNYDGQIKVSIKKVDRESQEEPLKSFIKNDSHVIDFGLSRNKKIITKFDKSIQLSVPYDSGTVKGQKLVVYYANPDGTFEKIGGVYDELTGMVAFKTNHLSKYFVKQEKVAFDDVESGSWAGNAIETLAALGVITGKDEYNFMPEEKVTRAEFAAMLDRLVTVVPEKSKVKNNLVLNFRDVSEKEWYRNYIYEICNQGWMKGKGDGRFDPNGYITIQEICSVIAKIVQKNGYLINEDEVAIVKEECSDWAKASVMLTKQLGITDNLTLRGFKPLEKARRDEVAVMLKDLMKILIEE